MKDESKTKKQLIDEMRFLRQRLDELEKDLTSHETLETLLRTSEGNYRAFIQYSTVAFCR
jgi:hypothetical protein